MEAIIFFLGIVAGCVPYLIRKFGFKAYVEEMKHDLAMLVVTIIAAGVWFAVICILGVRLWAFVQQS